jgi:hypothetical protein
MHIMLTADQIASLNALVDQNTVETARAAYAAVTGRAGALPAQIVDAEKALKAATAARAALLDHSAKGGQPTAAKIAAAARTVTDAADQVTFLKDTKAGLDAEVRRLHDALTLAQRNSYLPVLRHSAQQRLQAAAQLDAARAALAAAEKAYDDASAIVGFAANLYRATVQLVPPSIPLSQDAQARRYPIRHGAAAEAALWKSAGIEVA